MLGNLPGLDVHWGLGFGLVACLLAWFLMRGPSFGFAARMVGGNVRAALLTGCRCGGCIVIAAFLGGVGAGLAGVVEVAAVHGSANASLVAGYGYAGILVAFIARHNPLAVIPVALLLGGIGASGGLLQRIFDCPTPPSTCCRGSSSSSSSFSRSLYGRRWRRGPRPEGGDGVSAGRGVALAVVGGAIRISTPFLFVSLGECLTEKSGRVNLGPRGDAGDGRDGRLRRLVPDRLALARRAGGGRLPASSWARCTPGCARARA